jgi:hypothetical protein
MLSVASRTGEFERIARQAAHEMLDLAMEGECLGVIDQSSDSLCEAAQVSEKQHWHNISTEVHSRVLSKTPVQTPISRFIAKSAQFKDNYPARRNET